MKEILHVGTGLSRFQGQFIATCTNWGTSVSKYTGQDVKSPKCQISTCSQCWWEPSALTYAPPILREARQTRHWGYQVGTYFHWRFADWTHNVSSRLSGAFCRPRTTPLCICLVGYLGDQMRSFLFSQSHWLLRSATRDVSLMAWRR